jgi:hypothetical protein
MESELDQIADAAIACALSDDEAGFRLLTRTLDADALRDLGWRMARVCRRTMLAWAADNGLDAHAARAMWREVMIRQQAADND